MDMLEKLNKAASLPIVYYHKFLTSYKCDSDDIYVFCEGNEDFSYYCEVIERRFPGRRINKCFAECKNNVIEIWKFIEQGDFEKNRVLFFVDRDLSYWAGEPQYYGVNVYVTDGYSFENDAVNLHMFLKCLEDIYGFANYTETERERLKKFYVKKWKQFEEGSYELMAYILIKYRSSHEHTASKIVMSKCISIDSNVTWKEIVKGMPRLAYYRLQIDIEQNDLDVMVKECKTRFLADEEHYSIRGKWCLEFMILLCNHILENWERFTPSLIEGNKKKPKKLLDLTPRGAMTVLGAKIAPPQSLVKFLSENLGG